MPPRASMATCSILSVSRAACRACARRSSRPGPSWLSRPRCRGQHRDLRVPASRNSAEAARRLFRAGRPIAGTPAAAYLAHRGLAAIASPWLRYHPSCYVRVSDEASRQTWPALLAAITDVHGVVRGVHRTWLDPSGCGLAPIRAPRRSLGEQLGHGVRFGGFAAHLLVAGEGLETVLSVRAVLPRVPMLAGLSADHLAALELPSGVQRLYIARDGDAAGTRAAERLRRAPKRPASSRCATSIRCTATSTTTCAAWGLRGWLGMWLCSSTRPTSAGSAPMPPVRRRGRPDGPGNPAASVLRCGSVIGVVPLWAGEGRAPAFSRGRSGRRRARPATAPGNSFPPARTRAFAARSKRAAGRRPALRCGPDGAPHATCRMGTPGCRPAPPPAFGRHEGRGGRGLPNPEPPMLDDLLSPRPGRHG